MWVGYADQDGIGTDETNVDLVDSRVGCSSTTIISQHNDKNSGAKEHDEFSER